MFSRSGMPRLSPFMRALAATGLIACMGIALPAQAADTIGITSIVKDMSNPYFATMQKTAKQEAKKLGVDLTVAAGRSSVDANGQIRAIENAVARGDKGILITVIDSSVNHAIRKARKAGVDVIALDTVPTPADVVNMTYATDNFAAGVAIGKWAAATLKGKKAVIGMIDYYANRSVSLDHQRDQGFLKGMGIKVPDPNVNGSEAKSGQYTGGQGGDYVVAGHQAGQGTETGGRRAMELLLARNPDINLVYTLNEPTAYGAYQALKAAGKADSVLLVSIDGSCTGVGYVADGILDATSQQYPSRMVKEGMKSIVRLVKTGKKAQASEGLNFHDTGTQLVTNEPVAGVKSIDSKQASKICWGKS